MLGGRRSFWAGLLAVFLLLGAVDLHAPGDTFDPLGHSHEETYSSSARHPGQPAHFEPSLPATHPVCPLCLHRLRTGGAHLLPVAGLEPLARQTARIQGRVLPCDHGVRGPSGARAPPSI
jgi:hypothetical protein